MTNDELIEEMAKTYETARYELNQCPFKAILAVVKQHTRNETLEEVAIVIEQQHFPQGNNLWLSIIGREEAAKFIRDMGDNQ